MKRVLFAIVMMVLSLETFAQFGTFRKKEDLERFKDTRLIVVLPADSAYSSSIIAAMERYWTFTGFEYAEDTALYKYKKGDYAFMFFSKSKGSKIKARVGSSEEDMNALVIMRKFSRRITPDNLLAYAYCGNHIDTADWEGELTRAVQLMNNYFNLAVQAEGDGDLSESKMKTSYPSDKTQLVDKKLLVTDKWDLKGKEDAMTLFNGDAEEVESEEIYRAIKWQDNSVVYFYYSKDERNCHKLVVSAANSELMYYAEESPDKCKCNAKDLKAMQQIKQKAVGGRD